MEICIAVADWARGPTTWVLDAPGGAGTDARRRRRPRHARHTLDRMSPNGSTAGSTGSGPGAGMVVGWG
ncbi:hypothetical protein GCM10010259_47830 [Streptomyces daghestanicus]|uniref:Uncharacterized protein n=2 Tax=Streptomyces TaxID=1883 RepID=A0A918GQF4_STRGD|nr:hypothetical protein GCM10010238_49890 [Streptomyces niveoruber]GGU50952.1 hypothetical protein GCM10010259_47830 [Streptomyces daghestanicus]GHI31688.1 hypothetical protein Sdagh_34180 [Streptomyces daghestanicus]